MNVRHPAIGEGTIVLVVGGTGLLGAPLSLRLREIGCQVHVVSASRRFPPRSGIQSIQCDLNQGGVGEDLLRTTSPDVVINCAAITNVDACESDPVAERINTEWPRELAASASAAGIPCAHISTDAVGAISSGEGLPDEGAPVRPKNAYAHQKVRAEAGVLEASDGQALVVRTNFFGWSPQPERGLAAWALRELKAGHRVNGFSDVFFNPLYTEDAVDLLIDLLTSDVHGVIHLVGAECLNKYAFICRLAKVCSLDSSLVDEGRLALAELKAARSLNTCLSTGRMEGVLGRKPPTVTEGLVRMVRDETALRSKLADLGHYPPAR